MKNRDDNLSADDRSSPRDGRLSRKTIEKGLMIRITVLLACIIIFAANRWAPFN